MTGGGKGLPLDGWDMEMTFGQQSEWNEEMSSVGSGEELGFYSECDSKPVAGLG